jgi:hypothetical protein
MQHCKTCNVEHALAEFETYKIGDAIKYRKECKAARQQRRKKSVAEAAKIDPNTVPLPEQCIKCGTKPPQAVFKWRGDLKIGAWRNVCNRCSDVNADGVTHSQAYRKRQMEEDAEAYRRRNAATHLIWAHKNPDKIHHQKRVSDTDPNRRFKAIVSGACRKYGEDGRDEH